MDSQDHLSVIPGAAMRVAWDTTENIQAVMFDRASGSISMGARVPDRQAYNASQQIINYCHATRRLRRELRALWASLHSD
jgi:hypothetical protein